MSTLPPRPICIAGALSIASGVSSVMKNIATIADERFLLDIGFVGIPIGYGLLIGRSSSRKWALFFSITGLVVLSIIASQIGYQHVKGTLPFSYPDSAYRLIELTLALVTCCYIAITLRHDAHKAWFDAIVEEKTAASTLTRAVIVATAFCLFSQHVTQWWIKETHKKMFPLVVTIVPYDATNGGGIFSIGYRTDDDSSSRPDESSLPKLRIVTRSGVDGFQMMLSGVATEPVTIMIQSGGYENTPVTLDRDTPREIRVALRPSASE